MRAPILALLLACKAPPPATPVSSAQMRLPSPAEFTLGPGDRVSIKVWRHTDLDMDLVIAPDGTITYPLIGRVRLAGMTTTEAVAALSAAISTYYREPQVSLNVTEVRSQKVLVVGEVTTPAVLQLEDQMTILEALAHTGGINSSARTDNILLIRGGMEQPELLLVDVRGALAEGKVDQLIYLQRGDIIVVPTRSITNLSRYFREIQSVLAPFVAGSAIFRNAVSGGAQGTSSVLE